MGVHVPGQGIEVCSPHYPRAIVRLIFPVWQNYHWFFSILACLATFGIIGGYLTYRLIVKRPT
jgi:hypothetical protein